MSNLIWSYGDTKLDRQGRTIYFIEYANQTDSKRKSDRALGTRRYFFSQKP